MNNKDLFFISLGAIIGWGAFVLPGNFFLKDAGVINTAIGFSIAVIMIFFIEKSYSRLMSIYKNHNGGEFTFASKSIGPKSGFITGWLLLLSYISIIPLNATAIPLILDQLFGWDRILIYQIFDSNVYLSDLFISITSLLILGIVNLCGVSVSNKIQSLCVNLLLICVIILFLVSLRYLYTHGSNNLHSNFGTIDTNKIIRILAFAPWAFIGFDVIAQLSKDFTISAKKASIAAFIAVIFGAVIYNMLNIITAIGMPNEDISSSSWSTGDAVFNMLGNIGVCIISISMFGAVISGLNSFLIASDKLFKEMFEINNGIKSIMFILILSMFVPLLGRKVIGWFVDLSSVGASFAYLMTSISYFILSKKTKDRVISCLSCLVSFLFLLFLLTPIFDSNIPFVSVVILVIWMVLGCLLYFIFYKNKSELYEKKSDKIIEVTS